MDEDANLLIAMRSGRHQALRMFYLRFHPVLLDQAYRLGVRYGERDELVTECLGDIALRLVDARVTPRSLAAYVITSFRHMVASVYRRHDRRSTHEQSAGVVAETPFGVVAAGCSEYALQSVLGACPATADAPRAALTSLAVHLYTTLRERDRELLTWIGEHVPAGVIAEWRGTTATAVRVQVSRLRAKLRRTAVAYLAAVDGDARQELECFFRRAGIALVPHAPPPVVKTITSATLPCRLRVSDVTGDGRYVSPYDLEAE